MDVVTEYIVSYTRAGGCPDAPPGSETASGSPYDLSNLEENTPYRINIFARNSEGMSSELLLLQLLCQLVSNVMHVYSFINMNECHCST